MNNTYICTKCQYSFTAKSTCYKHNNTCKPTLNKQQKKQLFLYYRLINNEIDLKSYMRLF